jgi:hypothetical protein
MLEATPEQLILFKKTAVITDTERQRQEAADALARSVVKSVTDREREIVVNGIKFFAAVGEDGRRHLSACHESKEVLKSASRHLSQNGWRCKVKRARKDQAFWLLEAKDIEPRGHLWKGE